MGDSVIRQRRSLGLKRALVVEQLNEEQWHVVAGGAPMRGRAPEGAPSGVTDRFGALCDAMNRSRLYGLPVIIAPLDAPRRWATIEEVRSFDFGLPRGDAA